MIPGWFLNAKCWLLVTLSLFLLLIGACGGDEEPTATPTTVATPTESAGSAPAADPEEAASPGTAAQVVNRDKWGGQLRVAMTATDIPKTDLAPTEGGEGQRFVGIQINNGLTAWDLGTGSVLPGPMPGLAETYELDEDDPTKWTFRLREGLTFHDGTPINSEAVIVSWDRVLNEDSEYYKAEVAAVAQGLSGDVVESYRAIDELTVEVITRKPSGFTLDALLFLNVGSPTAIREHLDDFSNNHEGSGPFNYIEQTPRVSMTMERFEDYWGHVPNVDRVILRPIPEQTTRVAALRADEVDWIEVPSSDAIPSLREAGFDIYLKPYPHWYPYQMNLHKEPWDDIRVRRALQYAIDRESLCRDVLNGICIPGTGAVYEGHPHFGNPEEIYSYDPEKAKALLAEAGVELPLKFKVMISTSGSGQMSPLIINEFVQRNLKEVGIDMEIVTVEWNAMLDRTIWRSPEEGRTEPGNYQFLGENEDFDATNISYGTPWPNLWVAFFGSTRGPGSFVNIMGYGSDEMDAALDAAEGAFDRAEQWEALGRVHEIAVQDSPMIYMVHDLNPRAMNPRVKGYVQDQSWVTTLQDLWIEE
jgi:peptide/nickel transport system substrate-binding protein